MSKKQATPQHRARAVQEYLNGTSLSTIAKNYGIHILTMRNWLIAHAESLGISWKELRAKHLNAKKEVLTTKVRKPGRKSTATISLKKQIAKHVITAGSFREACKAFGLTGPTVKRYCLEVLGPRQLKKLPVHGNPGVISRKHPPRKKATVKQKQALIVYLSKSGKLQRIDGPAGLDIKYLTES